MAGDGRGRQEDPTNFDGGSAGHIHAHEVSKPDDNVEDEPAVKGGRKQKKVSSVHV